MEFKQLFDDDRAVSPVIGVILMVAITVILAAVIGTFVLGLGDQIQNTTPTTSFGFESSNSSQNVTIVHESGDSIQAANLNISSTQPFTYVGKSDTGNGTGSASWSSFDNSASTVSAGNSVEINAGPLNDGADTFTDATVRVIYSSPDSDSSSTLAKKEF